MDGSLGKVIAVTSGKGGVGKTTVSVNVAAVLAQMGYRVGLLDADLYGPDAALMLGVTRHERAKHVEVWRRDRRPLEPTVRHGVRLFSVQLLLGEDQAFATGTSFAKLLLNRLVSDVSWGDLDYLLIDLPPGTADVQQHIAVSGIAGAIVVVTPQDVAHLDARKLLTMLEVAGTKVVGGVENMASLTCPECGTTSAVFPPVAHDRSIWSSGIRKLASIPLASHSNGDEYRPLVLSQPNSPAADALRLVAHELVRRA